MSQNEAIETVESASKAWNGGQGVWPQMSAMERINIMKNIIVSLKEKRDEIIHILVWEICKTVKDATTEFG